MDTSQPNPKAEQPSCGGPADQICEAKTNLNNKADKVVEVGRECKCQTVVFNHDADQREKIANLFEQLKDQLPPAARKIVESPSHEGLPKTREVYYHGSAVSCPPGYRRGSYYLFYGPHLWEFLQARYDEVRVSLQCAGFATKRIAGNPSEVDQEIVRIRRENCVDEVVEVGEVPGVIVRRRKRVLVLRGPAALQNALRCLRVLKGGAR